MEILLVRHGRSRWSGEPAMTGAEFIRWLQRYEADGIDDAPPPETRQQVASAGLVLSSDLTRAIESAAALRPDTPVRADPLFREPALPVPRHLTGSVRLNPHLWANALRAAWLLGYSPGVESRGQVRHRARQAALELTRQAARAQTVALVAHGIINIFIGLELRALGWQGPRVPRMRHWGCIRYRPT